MPRRRRRPRQSHASLDRAPDRTHAEAALQAKADATDRAVLEALVRRYGAARGLGPADCDQIVEAAWARRNGAPPQTAEAQGALDAFDRVMDAASARAPWAVWAVRASLDRHTEALVAQARARRARASIDQRLKWLTCREPGWVEPPARRATTPADAAILQREADDQALQAEALTLCDPHLTPQIAVIGETARDRDDVETFRRALLKSTEETAREWAVFRAHGAAVVEAIDALIETLATVFPAETDAVHQTMAWLRPWLPALQWLSEEIPPGGRTGGYKSARGRPGRKQARDDANAKLRDLGVPYKARRLLLQAWGFLKSD
jgi:hypothetical protein